MFVVHFVGGCINWLVGWYQRFFKKKKKDSWGQTVFFYILNILIENC